MAHVLVVEDDELQWRALERYLRLGGHSASWVSTGRQALDFLHREAAGFEPRLDLVLLDLELQGTLGGLDVAKNVVPRIVTVVTSGHPLEEILERVERPLAGVRVYLTKPFDFQDLDVLLAHVRPEPEPSLP